MPPDERMFLRVTSEKCVFLHFFHTAILFTRHFKYKNMNRDTTDDADRIIDYVRNQEIEVEELHRIYNQFMRDERGFGFDRGCDYMRDILSRQRSRKKQNIEKMFKEVLQVIEDKINRVLED